MIKQELITIAISGTESSVFGGRGYCLVGLVLPALDSSTIQFVWAPKSDGTYVDVYTNSGTPAAATLGTASTGSRVQAVPEEIGRLAETGFMKLKVASQTSLARTITGLFQQRG